MFLQRNKKDNGIFGWKKVPYQDSSSGIIIIMTIIIIVIMIMHKLNRASTVHIS